MTQFAKTAQENPPDFVLWSQKLYDEVFDFLTNYQNLKNSKIEDLMEDINYIVSKLESDQKLSPLIVCSDGKLGEKEVLWNLFYNNQNAVLKLLSEDFKIGAICTVPINSKEDRTYMIMAKEI